MACLLGSVLNIPVPDLIKFELTMKGIFRTDLALGSDHFRTFALIEFEPAEEKTLFKSAPNNTATRGRRSNTVLVRWWIGLGYGPTIPTMRCWRILSAAPSQRALMP